MALLQFPKDLNLDIQPYMIFNSFKWTMRGKKTQDIRSIQQSEDSIILPISSNGVIDSINNNWESGVGLAAGNIKDVFLQSLISKVSDAFGDLGKYISARRGFIVNDYASLAFNGTDFRNFEFSFTLIPKNQQESNTVIDIVKTFKRNSLPEYRGWKILYPNYWNVLIKFPSDQDVVKIKNCVINNFSVNTFTDGNPTINTDGNPQKTEITVNVTELQKLDRVEFA